MGRREGDKPRELWQAPIAWGKELFSELNKEDRKDDDIALAPYKEQYNRDNIRI